MLIIFPTNIFQINLRKGIWKRYITFGPHIKSIHNTGQWPMMRHAALPFPNECFIQFLYLYQSYQLKTSKTFNQGILTTSKTYFKLKILSLFLKNLNWSFKSISQIFNRQLTCTKGIDNASLTKEEFSNIYTKDFIP